jgi:hypothetical protein
MGEANRATAAGQEMEWRGHTYRLADFSVQMIGLTVARLQRRTVEAVERMRGVLPDDTFAEWMRATIALIGSGHFDYGSTPLADWSFSPEGMQYGAFLQLKAGAATPEEADLITEELVAEMWAECKEKILALAAANGATDPTKAPLAGAGNSP